MPKGQFQPNPPGQKTSKMQDVERKLGRSLEDDFDEHYVKQQWGQKRMADRWGVKRSLIFGNLPGGRRSWAKMLGLPVRKENTDVAAPEKANQAGRSCSMCLTSDVSLDSAHWIPREEKGPSTWWNLISLCPNCHRRLDSRDDRTIAAVRVLLMSRAAQRFAAKNPKMSPEEFGAIMIRIVNRA